VGGRDRRRPPAPRGPWLAIGLAVVGVLAVLLVIGLVGGGGNGNGRKVAQETTTTKRKHPKRPKPAPTASGVVVRVTPNTPTYVCVDSGAGTPIRFEGILQAPRTFRARRLRLNLGKTDVQLSKNGKPVALSRGPNPVGFDFTPRSTKPLPVGQRPCR
jgi:hypothetical protein